MKYIKRFDEITMADIAVVGGKNASLGQMISDLGSLISVPHGFAITAKAYRHYIAYNNIEQQIHAHLSTLNRNVTINTVQTIGKKIRSLFLNGTIADDLQEEIEAAYTQLSSYYHTHACDVAIRSSATAEDLPAASFAGQQDSFLHVSGIKNVLYYYKKSLASLFTDRAIIYRHEHAINHESVFLSTGVQKMVRSDLATAGIAFSLDPDSGFCDVVTINASYGLGQAVVQGGVNADEYVVFKPLLDNKYQPIIKKQCGGKKIKMVYTHNKKNHTATIQSVSVSKPLQQQYALTNTQIVEIAKATIAIENHYSTLNNHPTPIDIEWAYDGHDNNLYIVQARPETVISQQKKSDIFMKYVLKKQPTTQPVVTGQSIGKKIVSGTARIVNTIDQLSLINDGDIIVTTMTNPDWTAYIKKAGGIVTNYGARTCHAAIVSRELDIPAVIGCINATTKIKPNSIVTLDCSQGQTGYVYPEALLFEKKEMQLHTLSVKKNLPSIMINCADPAKAFSSAHLPVDGIGLVRLEFIMANLICIHPLATLYPEKITSKKILKQIQSLSSAYSNAQDFFIQTIAQSIGMIAASMSPKPVTVRFSDFKSNEYKNLIGGHYFEPEEENPMMGLRGASRYYHPTYTKAFELECKAIVYARDTMGFNNIKVMVPCVRTAKEADIIIKLLSQYGLARKQNNLEILMMCETPANVLLIQELSRYFDGFSIGSNDLTQFILAIDRNSQDLSLLFDEYNDAVKQMLVMAINGAHACNKPISICGQGPSDNYQMAQFLIDHGIDSLSLNPDIVIDFLTSYQKKNDTRNKDNS